MTTALSTLKTRLGVMIGDSADAYLASYDEAINNAARELYPILYKRVIDETLITGNILPPFIWSSSTALKLYSATNATLAKTTTAGLFRNGSSSAKVTASAADGYLSINSDTYPRLLDLMDIDDVEFKCWAEPEVANDAFLTLAYEDADASETTVDTTTTCPASVMTLLESESNSIPDEITKIGLRMRVHTNAKYTYFDPPRIMGKNVYEYLLPDDFQDGDVKQVWIQTSGYSDDACDDLHPRFQEVFGWKTIHDGTYKYLRLPYLSTHRKLRLIGISPLEDNLSSDTDTITLDSGGQIQLLLSYAAYLLYEMQRGVVSGDSKNRYDLEVARWLGKVEMLKHQHRMPRLSSQIGWTIG